MFNVIFVIIGTLIGAGFASGSEIALFFNQFGIYGLFGLCISISIILFVIYRVLSLNLVFNSNSYTDFIYKKFKNKYILLFLSSIINIFSLISFYIMVAGFSSLFLQEFYLPKFIGNIIICIPCYFIFNKSINAIVKVNIILIPFLLLLLIFLGFKTININSLDLYTFNRNGFVTSSVLYASYNLIILIPILISLKDFIKNKRNCIIISVISSSIIFLLAILIFLILSGNINFKDIELPIVFIASKINIIYKYVYSISILIAIFTSSIASRIFFFR